VTEPMIPADALAAERAALCAQLGHPGACYNEALDKTWCACGAVIRDGDHFEHVTCCGGPLDRRTS
jgi:hypothetical protein